MKNTSSVIDQYLKAKAKQRAIDQSRFERFRQLFPGDFEAFLSQLATLKKSIEDTSEFEAYLSETLQEDHNAYTAHCRLVDRLHAKAIKALKRIAARAALKQSVQTQKASA